MSGGVGKTAAAPASSASPLTLAAAGMVAIAMLCIIKTMLKKYLINL